MLAGDEFRQVAALLVLIAVAEDLVHAKVGMRAIRQADGGGGAADLLHRHDVLQVAHARAAVFRRYRDAQQADGAQFRPKIGGEIVGDVDRGGARRDFVGGEGFHLIAQHVRDLTEVEIQAAHLIGHAIAPLRPDLGWAGETPIRNGLDNLSIRTNDCRPPRIC